LDHFPKLTKARSAAHYTLLGLVTIRADALTLACVAYAAAAF